MAGEVQASRVRIGSGSVRVIIGLGVILLGAATIFEGLSVSWANSPLLRSPTDTEQFMQIVGVLIMVAGFVAIVGVGVYFARSPQHSEKPEIRLGRIPGRSPSSDTAARVYPPRGG